MNRRYDIDWLRVIAIGLLLIYHVAIAFQPWGIMIGFITNKEPWMSLWTPMMMLNIWRIPLLFFVSGMGVYFAMQHRSWGALVGERAKRILLPFVFGMFAIVPIANYIWQRYNGFEISYAFHPGHLWFLGNIFIYVLLLAPLFYLLKRKPDSKFVRALQSMLATPLGLIPVVGVFVAEAMIIKPYPYELYVLTPHGFFLGFFAFFFGFCFVLAGDAFWRMLVSWRWLFLTIAAVLCVIRIGHLGMNVPYYLLVIESQCWILTMLAFAKKHLNRPGRVLNYLSGAAYPVYIVHMIWLMLGSALVFPVTLAVEVKFAILLLITFAGCVITYELIRRIPGVRMLFGIARP